MCCSVCCTLQHVQHVSTPCNKHCNAFARRIADVSAIRCSVCQKVLQCMLYTATLQRGNMYQYLDFFLKKKPSAIRPRWSPDCETALFFFKSSAAACCSNAQHHLSCSLGRHGKEKIFLKIFSVALFLFGACSITLQRCDSSSLSPRETKKRKERKGNIFFSKLSATPHCSNVISLRYLWRLATQHIATHCITLQHTVQGDTEKLFLACTSELPSATHTATH